MEEKVIIFIDRMSKRFGKTAEIEFTDMYDFIDEQLDDDISKDDAVTALITMFRDDYIDYHALEKLINYLGYELPVHLERYQAPAKDLLRTLSKQVESEHELIRRLFLEYQNGKINIQLLEVCACLMGRHLSEDFLDLPYDMKIKSKWVNNAGTVIRVDKEIAEFVNCFTGIINVDNASLFIPTRVYNTAFDFVIDYMDQNEISEKVLTNSGLDRRYKNRLKTNGIKSKIDVFRLIFVLNMSTQVAKEFMTICGFSFTPLDKIDLFFLDYLNGKYPKVKTLKELTELSKNYCYAKFEWPYWE